MLQHAALEIPLEVVRASASAVWNCCRSPANRKVVTSSDILPFLIRLLERTTDETIHMPVIGIIHSCAVDVSHCCQIVIFTTCVMYKLLFDRKHGVHSRILAFIVKVDLAGE